MTKKLLVILLISLFLPGVLYAQEAAPKKKKSVIYERPTYKTISQLYWALSKLDPEKDEYIDNFLAINECEMYTDFSQNEFEWKGIRESAREFLTTNKKSFPIYFEFIQPLKFAEYDLESETFEIWDHYKIHGVRRFEVLSEDVFTDTCGFAASVELEGYPKGLYVELNRPLTLDKISIKPEIAQTYVAINNEENMRTRYFTPDKEKLYETRDAYLVMKLKIFSYIEDRQGSKFNLARVMASLDGYEIYGDLNREMLLYSENFKRKKKRSGAEIEMKKRYQQRLKEQYEERRRAAAEKAAEEATVQ